MGYFSRVDCKGRHSDGNLCRSYRGSSPSGKYNPMDIDESGFCRDCRRTLDISRGQLSLRLVK